MGFALISSLFNLVRSKNFLEEYFLNQNLIMFYIERGGRKKRSCEETGAE
jgi:hypothetical protein